MLSFKAFFLRYYSLNNADTPSDAFICGGMLPNETYVPQVVIYFLLCIFRIFMVVLLPIAFEC